MIETESSEYLEAIQVHIEQARARVSAAVLPLLEHKTGLSMPGQRADITNVKLAVSCFKYIYYLFILLACLIQWSCRMLHFCDI